MKIKDLKDYLASLEDQESEIYFYATTDDSEVLVRWDLISVSNSAEDERTALTFNLASL